MSVNKEDEIIKKILEAFPALKFNFKRIEGWLTIKPDGFLGSEVFAKLKALMNEMQAEYVSAGKLTHFRIPMEPKEQILEQWYAEQQKLKDQPLLSALTLNLNIEVKDSNELERMLQLLKKYVIPVTPEKGGRK